MIKIEDPSDFNAVVLQAQRPEATANSELYVPLDTRVYGLNAQNYVISSATVYLNGAHATVKLWNRSGYAGVLVFREADVAEFLEKLGLVPA